MPLFRNSVVNRPLTDQFQENCSHMRELSKYCKLLNHSFKAVNAVRKLLKNVSSQTDNRVPRNRDTLTLLSQRLVNTANTTSKDCFAHQSMISVPDGQQLDISGSTKRLIITSKHIVHPLSHALIHDRSNSNIFIHFPCGKVPMNLNYHLTHCPQNKSNPK